jgi:hypothetical protein
VGSAAGVAAHAALGRFRQQGRDLGAQAQVVSITDVSQTEGTGGLTTFVFNVTLSAPSAQLVTVQYQTIDGSAENPTTATPGETCSTRGASRCSGSRWVTS